MALELLLFVIGFVILVTSARVLVAGSVSIARVLKVSSWIIGMVIVGFGTSIPEFAVSVSSALAGNNVGIGTLVGANIFNLLMILGLVAFVSPIFIQREWYKDFFINIGATSIAALFIFFPILGPDNFMGLSEQESLCLSALFIIWFILLLKRDIPDEDGIDYRIFASFTSVVMIVAGIIGVFIGGRWVVSGAETLAYFFSVPPHVIGLTVVGIGTSLPELTVSIVAVIKHQRGIAIGNVIGSNIFRSLGILGVSGVLKPIPVIEHVGLDLILGVVSAVIVTILALFFGERGVLSRREGIFLVLAYLVYLFFVLMSV